MAEVKSVLIESRRLIDGTGRPAIDDGAVLLAGGRIVSVGRAADVRATADAQGLAPRRVDGTLLPGLIDGHAHVALGWDAHPGWQAANQDRDLLMTWTIAGAQAALAAGVTTLRDCGAPGGITLKLKRALADATVLGPRLLACGPAITTTAGHGEFIGVTADTADELRKTIRELCREGADHIKIMASGGSMDPETNRRRAQYSEDEMRVAIEDAHRLGRPVVAHANATESIRRAVAAGVDVVAHCNWLGLEHGTIEYDPAVAETMAKNSIAVDLNIEGGSRPYTSVDGWAQDWSAPGAPQNRWDLMADMRRRGVRIFFTSDHFGPALARFPQILARAATLFGMAAEELVWRASGLPAESIGLGEETGTLQPGRSADVLIVDGDLTADVAALQQVRGVYLRGQEVVRDGWIAPPPITEAALRTTPDLALVATHADAR